MRTRIVAITILLVLSAATCAFADNLDYYYGTPGPATPTPSFGTYVNFDVLPNGTATPSSTPVGSTDYQAVGLTINSLDPTNPLYYLSGSSTSGPNYVSGQNFVLNGQFVFTKPEAAVGLNLDGPTTVTFYGASGLLGSFTPGISSSGNSYVVFNDRTGANISSMNVTSSLGAVDDLQFSPVNVPEPSILSLFGMGLAGIAAFRWKLAKLAI
jgi:hypothetical protein